VAEGSQLKRSLALFSGPFRRNLFILSALCICGSVASLFLSSYAAFLAKELGATTDTAAILFGMAIWGAYLIGNIANILVTDRVGRKPLLIGGGVVTTLALLAAAKVGLSEGNAALVFAIFAIGAFCYWGGVNQAIWQYTAELFPTEVRGTARGFATSWTRVAAVFTGLFTPTMIGTLGFGASMLIFAIFAFGIIVCGLLLPEVKGRELGAIAEEQRVNAPSPAP
jgi:putative MFS transporter